ncbi:MAG TPA: NAD(P)-binding protein [Verrucomicrobiae bacterium]|jgi:protoporphyrinogen oxidase|nr:NAD(P)-binding protein [Verrucomicrobiae bacterium]
MAHTEIVVLGGGISGLAAACALQHSRADYMLLERRPSVGGLTRTSQVGDFCFDYTGHFLHLRRYESPSKIPFAGLQDSDWKRVERRSACYVANTMVTAPIQYNLGELPQDILDKCIQSYEQRQMDGRSCGTSFRDYIVRNFGTALADLFLIPQNEKTFAISLDGLCMNAIKRFFPVADDAAIRRGIRGESALTAGYNSTFWYPVIGGIEALTRGFSRGLGRISENQDVCSIDLKRRTLRTVKGTEITWDALLTSVPLPSFCRMTGEPDLIEAAKQLTHSTTVAVNVGLRGEVAAPLANRHWVYVPDRNLPIYRVGVYSNISDGTCAPGRVALYAEVGLSAEQVCQLDLLSLESEVLSCLEKLEWLDRSKVECVMSHILHCAYVHHTPVAERLVGSIFDRFSTARVFPIGRYGRWDYTSMEDSIEDGISTVDKVLK